MFPSFVQTGPGDLARSSWDAAVEGQQNFPELDQGDLYNVDSEDMMLNFGQPTPRLDRDGSEDLNGKWTPEMKAPKAEPMRRLTSKSSAGSSKNRTLKASKKAPRPRVHAPLMARTSSQYSNLEVTGNAPVFQEATIGNGRIMDPQQYLAQDLDTLSVSSHMPGHQAFNPALMGFQPDGLPYAAGMGFAMGQHVNPCATQIEMYDTGLSGNSPYSLGSLSPDSRNTSPGADDTWSAGLATSPTTDAHDSPPLNGPSPRMTRKMDGSELVLSEDLHGSVFNGLCDDFSLPPPFGGRCMSGEGESARDHYLYKNAFPQADGLFHCPWEGTPSCNHRPEKLKCNYDKFVDSHLKPYRCKVESCENTRFSSTACLLRHEREAHAMHGHGDKPFLCTYEGCERSNPGCGFPRQWNLRDHMRRVHNDNSIPGPAPAAAAAPASSPPATGSSSHKGRKRLKKDTSESSAGKKSSSKSGQGSGRDPVPPKVEEGPTQQELEQWYEHQKALQSLVQGWTQPDDPYFIQQYGDAQGHMEYMQRISLDIQSRSSNWQQSG
ncbi:hypothetical protein GE09DRAFT_1173121 [Coniochaeta sp. 2T2.1]|nr:hypothetical protein GE09DRAFT_1173121 [Coniochaeta sp. 2T2.1]